MTKSEAAKLVMMLLAAFPGAKVNEGTSAVYEEMLADLEFKVARIAVTRLLKTHKFPVLPTIAEIREQCGLVRRELADARAVAERRRALPAPYGDVKQLLAGIGGKP